MTRKLDCGTWGSALLMWCLTTHHSECLSSPHFLPLQKPATAWGYLTAHMTRIHDIDWSYQEEHQLTTCSHDSSVKFWDTNSPREPISIIKTRSQPVWRAKNYVRILRYIWKKHFSVSFPFLYISLSPSFSQWDLVLPCCWCLHCTARRTACSCGVVPTSPALLLPCRATMEQWWRLSGGRWMEVHCTVYFTEESQPVC